jgi:hypothetical protein
VLRPPACDVVANDVSDYPIEAPEAGIHNLRLNNRSMEEMARYQRVRASLE